MALVLADRVRETTTTAGTGTITLLGAVPSCQSFAVVGNGNTTYYTIVAYTGTEYEVGIGTYTSSGTTLSRDTVLASSNGGSLVNFSIGTKDVFVDYPAGRAVYEDAAGNVDGYPITGGTINNTVIGSTTPAAGTFTTLTAQNETLKGTGQNFFTYSQTFTNAIWNAINTSATDNTTVAPNGTTTAATFTLSSAAGNYFKQNVVVTAGQTYTFSFYALRGTATDMRYSVYNNSASAEIVAPTSYYSSTNASTWSRITLTFTTPSGCTNIGVYPSRDAASTGTFFVWGAQLELASSAGTYIPTTAAAVYGTPTLSFSGVASIGLQSDGSLYETSAGTGNIRLYTNNISQEQARVSHTASAVNYVQLTGGVTGGNVQISAQGSDASTGISLVSKGGGGSVWKGDGGVYFQNNAANNLFSVENTSSTVNRLTATGSATGSGPRLFAQGSDTNIDINLTTKGTGAVNLNTGGGMQVKVLDATTSGSAYWTMVGSSGGYPFISVDGTNPNINAVIASKGIGAVRFSTNGTSGPQQFMVSHTASAVNYVQATGGVTGVGVALSAQGSDSNIAMLFQAKGTQFHLFQTNGANQFGVAPTASAVNYVQVTGSSVGFAPYFITQGSDTNISFAYSAKGTGAHDFYTNGFSFAQQFKIFHTASAVNFVQVTGAATGGRPTIIAQGSDTNINFVVASKGSGSVGLRTDSSTTQVSVIHTASAVNFLTATGSVAGSGPIFSVAGTDTNVDLNLTTKGTGKFYISDTQGGGSLASPMKIVLPAQYSTTAGTVNKIDLYGLNANYGIGLTVIGSTASVDYVSGGTATTRHAFFTGNGVSTLQSVVAHTTSAVNYLQATGGATGSGVTLSAQGSDTNIDINLVPKGTGTTVYTGGVTVNGLLTAQTEVLKGSGQNFLLWSADFSNAVWGGVSSNVTRTTTTIDFTNASAYAYQLADPAVTGSTYTFSVTLSSTNKTAIAIRLVGSATSGGNQSLITLTATPTRYSVTATLPSGNTAFIAGFENRVAQGGDGSLGSITVSNAQLELGSTVNTYIATTTAKVYGTPTLSFSGVSTIGLESNGSLFVQPAGTGALQAQATTSSATGGNARGANAVDWQMSRNAASRVASGAYSVVTGGYANASSASYSSIAGGYANTSSGGQGFIGAGENNTASGYNSVVVGGGFSTSAGYYNFIGGGFTNSGTSGSAVTTQSGTMNATTAVTLSGSNASIKVGQYITGTSIAANTYVAAISGTSLTLSQAASGSSTSTLSFYTPHGVVVGGGNNQATGSYSFIGGGGDAGTATNRNRASGDWSFVGGGIKNTASGNGSIVVGGGYISGVIYPNTASGNGSIVVGGFENNSTGQVSFIGAGYFNVASGTNSFIGAGQNNNANADGVFIGGGYNGTTRSIQGIQVSPACSSPINGSQGTSQGALLVLARQTTDATATVLTSNSSAASTTNQIILPNNSAYYFKGSVIANVTGAANGAAWEFSGAIMRGANAASTVLIGTPAINRVAATAGATAWLIALTADTTNGGLAVTVTGAASTTIRWVCKAETTEVTF